jgi:hypothetical protein
LSIDSDVWPRIGLTYDVFGDGRTAIRAGFGTLYDAIPTTEQPVIVIVEIPAEGTLAAGEALTAPHYLNMLLQATGNPANDLRWWCRRASLAHSLVRRRLLRFVPGEFCELPFAP